MLKNNSPGISHIFVCLISEVESAFVSDFFFNNVQIVNKLGIELYFLSLEKRVSMLTVDH